MFGEHPSVSPIFLFFIYLSYFILFFFFFFTDRGVHFLAFFSCFITLLFSCFVCDKWFYPVYFKFFSAALDVLMLYYYLLSQQLHKDRYNSDLNLPYFFVNYLELCVSTVSPILKKNTFFSLFRSSLIMFHLFLLFFANICYCLVNGWLCFYRVSYFFLNRFRCNF